MYIAWCMLSFKKHSFLETPNTNESYDHQYNAKHVLEFIKHGLWIK